MTTIDPKPKRPGTFQSLGQAFTSWRTASVTLSASPSVSLSVYSSPSASGYSTVSPLEY